MTWQPIETAPKDGTKIRARIPGYGDNHVISFYRAWYGNQWVHQSYDEADWPPCWTEGACWGSNENNEPSVRPTAWQPLPPAPETR